MSKRDANPAKVFLRRYLSLSGRVDALTMAINQAMERAWNTGVSLKEVKVLSSPAEHDPMARDVCNAVDACAVLYQVRDEAAAALQEIAAAIDSLDDERQKEILTRRYINGQDFSGIVDGMPYEAAQVYRLHGNALIAINEWLKKKEGLTT